MRVEESNVVIKYINEFGYEDRFSNIYDGFKVYFVMCINDCYLVFVDIECESDM